MIRTLHATILLVSVAVVSSTATAAEFQWHDDAEAGLLNLTFGDQSVLQYVYTVDTSTPERTFDTSKPFHHVYGPGTDVVVTKGPGGKYPHHRGLYVGWNKTGFDGKTQDFWHTRHGETQRHIEFAELEADENAARMTAVIHWLDSDGKPVIAERRTVQASRFERTTDSDISYGWQIDWSTRLESRRGRIELSGDRQHAGFQFRAAQPVAEANSARYIRPEGSPQQSEAFQVNDRTDPDKHVDLGWLAATFPLEEHRFTVEYFESPDVPRPSRYSERPYGRFGAFFETAIEPDQPLEMSYRINVSTGEPPSQQAIQQRFDRFVQQLESGN